MRTCLGLIGPWADALFFCESLVTWGAVATLALLV